MIWNFWWSLFLISQFSWQSSVSNAQASFAKMLFLLAFRLEIFSWWVFALTIFLCWISWVGFCFFARSSLRWYLLWWSWTSIMTLFQFKNNFWLKDCSTFWWSKNSRHLLKKKMLLTSHLCISALLNAALLMIHSEIRGILDDSSSNGDMSVASYRFLFHKRSLTKTSRMLLLTASRMWSKYRKWRLMALD